MQLTSGNGNGAGTGTKTRSEIGRGEGATEGREGEKPRAHINNVKTVRDYGNKRGWEQI